MDSALIAEIMKSGGLMGAIYIATIIPLGWYVSKQSKELKAVQDARATEAQQVTDKLITLNNRWNETIQQHLRTVDAIDTTLHDVKTVMTSLSESFKAVDAVDSGITELKTSMQSVRDLLMKRGR